MKGNGSTSHLSAEAFNLATGLEISHVAYKGSSPAVTDLLAGRVQVMFDTVLSAPAGLPSPITQALALKLDAFTKDPDIRKQLDALGLLVDGSGPAAFSAFIEEESARMDKLIKKAGIRFE